MKYVIQFLWYLLEIDLAATLLFTVSSLVTDNNFFGWYPQILSDAFMAKFTVFLVVYQLSVYAILTLRDSAQKDALLATMKLVNLAILRVEYNKQFHELETLHEKYTNDSTLFLDDKDKENFKEIRDHYNAYCEGHTDKNDCLFYLRNKLVNLQHGYDYLDLAWRLSFLLRFVK